MDTAESSPPLPAWRSTCEGVAAIPFLGLAVLRPMLAETWPWRGLLASPPRPGAPRADSLDRTIAPQPDWRRREAAITLGAADVAEGPLPDPWGRHLGLRT